jgi:hypothetical protein
LFGSNDATIEGIADAFSGKWVNQVPGITNQHEMIARNSPGF